MSMPALYHMPHKKQRHRSGFGIHPESLAKGFWTFPFFEQWDGGSGGFAGVLNLWKVEHAVFRRGR